MMSLSNSKVYKARYVTVQERKIRVNAPEGWVDEDEPEASEDDLRKELDRRDKEAAEIRLRELADITALKEQILNEATSEANRTESNARNEADRIIREALVKAEQGRGEIHEEAYKIGYDEGVAEGRVKGEELLDAARETVEEAKRTRADIISGVEPELVDLISGICDKLLHDKAAFNPQLILCLIKAGLAETDTASDDISILVCDEDYDTVLEHKEELVKVVGGAVNLQIVRDPSLNKADCIIKTPYGYIDASLEQGFAELQENLYYIKDTASTAERL